MTTFICKGIGSFFSILVICLFLEEKLHVSYILIQITLYGLLNSKANTCKAYL